VLDLRTLSVETVPQALGGLERLQTAVSQVLPGASVGVSPTTALSSFLTREQTLTALLRLVSVPVLAMALYFVALTASLIIEAESGEIAVFASRGARAGHVLLLYVLEWVLLAIPLAAVAPLPAAEFARAMGATSGFLHFVSRRSLPIFLQRRDFEYAAAAAALAVGAALLPTVFAMSRSVVAARLRSSRTVEQPLWQRAYLDALDQVSPVVADARLTASIE
jgi:putative ABC transport system permease protein